MKNNMDFFNDKCRSIFEANKLKGFWDERLAIPKKMRDTCLFTDEEIISVEKAFKGQLLMLMVSELSEAMEADRKDLMDDKLTHREGFEVELADCVIRIMDAGGGFGLDLEGAISEKLEYNTSRPYKHGKNY